MFRLFALGALVALGGWLAQDRIEALALYPFDATEVAPGDVGLDRVRAVRIDVHTAEIVTWLADPAPGKPVIFYLHGNAGGLKDRAGRFQLFLDRGYGLIAPAYRGSSGSSGLPVEEDISRDMTSVWLARYLPKGPRVIYGESLGTGVAVLSILASPAGDYAKGLEAAGVVLEAPFTSIPDVAATQYPALAPLADQLVNRWPTLKWAGALIGPLFILHGTDDTLIPIEMGRQVYAAAPSDQKTLREVKGAGHTDLWRSDTLPDLWRFIDRFGVSP